MNKSTGTKLLFCLLNNSVSGGNRILLELANRSLQAGYQVDLYFADESGEPFWFNNKCTIRDTMVVENAAELQLYDFVYVSNSSMVPMVLPYCNNNKLVLISQGFESYCYGDNLAQLFSDKKSFESILKLPVPIIATSKSIQSLLLNKINRSSYLVPVAIDHKQFRRYPRIAPNSSPKRVLAVGDYLTRFKGIMDLADALEYLSKDMAVRLVLITQQKSARSNFSHYSFPIDFHYCPEQAEIAAIYASCDVYCCASWYEGFGLPCLESFSVGVPVVSTDNYGVREFGKDRENVIIAQANNPADLAEKLKCVLSDNALASTMIENGVATASRYTWDETMKCFFKVMEQINYSSSAQANPCTPAQALQYLQNLERDGFFTPLVVERQLMTASSELKSLCERICEGSIDKAEALDQLKQIRSQLQKHLENPQASYYHEFKGRFDLCQLLSSFEEPSDWKKLLLNFSKR